MIRRAWTTADDALLRRHYAYTSAANLARLLDRTGPAVLQRALRLGLRKCADYMAHQAGRFRPGQRPANAGLRRPGWAPGRMGETQFKPGRPAALARNYVPVGSLRVTKDGLLQRKLTDDPTLPPARRWRAVHALVWEAAHGPIPRGHLVVFRPGCRTTDPGAITLDRLELITRSEHMRRNSVHTRYPADVVDLIRLRNALIRKLNRHTAA